MYTRLFQISVIFCVYGVRTYAQVGNGRPQTENQKTYQIQNNRNNNNNFNNYQSQSRANEWASTNIDELAVNLLARLYADQGKSYNLFISPLSIWTVLMMLYEAASGRTKEELRNVLNARAISDDTAREAYRIIYRVVNKETREIESSTLNLIISSTIKPPDDIFKSKMEDTYKANLLSLNLRQKDESIRQINDWISGQTKGRINHMVQRDEINETQLYMANAAYFKARWMTPFNKTASFTDNFKNENEEIIGDVHMMNQKLPLKYAFNSDLRSQIVEIPYVDNLASMVVILPHKRVPFSFVLEELRRRKLSSIIGSENLNTDEVDLYLPRLIVRNELTLNKFLSDKLPLMFSSAAEFPVLSKDAYVSRVVHNAEIESTEEGSVASAATVAQISYKSPTVRFHANRPFIYFIIEKSTRTVLFAGTYTNPRT